MNPDLFSNLLDQHMRRIRASAAAVATEIGMSREAVNNWRRGFSKPSKKHRDKVVDCANYLRLSENECNELLGSVGFNDEYALFKHDKTTNYTTIFDQLEQAKPYPILLVLSQAHIDQPPQKQLIIEMAKAKYPKNETLHIQMPYSKNIEVADFFQFIGSQLNLEAVNDELSFEFALNDLLKKTTTTLVITRFEQGNQICREILAGIFRNLCEMYPGKLQLIICGGEGLSALKYAQGNLSLLNIAASYLLEFDLKAWLNNHLTDTFFIDDGLSANELLDTLVGNHPALASSLCQGINKNLSVEELTNMVTNSDMLYCDFNQVIQHSDTTKLLNLLKKSELGIYRPYLQNDTLRKLFWLNLIRKDSTNHLIWQSEPIRQFGISMMKELVR